MRNHHVNPYILIQAYPFPSKSRRMYSLCSTKTFLVFGLDWGKNGAAVKNWYVQSHSPCIPPAACHGRGSV
jgi:hypothetical protein